MKFGRSRGSCGYTYLGAVVLQVPQRLSVSLSRISDKVYRSRKSEGRAQKILYKLLYLFHVITLTLSHGRNMKYNKM